MQHLGQRLQLVARISGARGVRGRIEYEPLGARRDRALEVLGLKLEALVDRGWRDDRRAVVDRHHFRIAHPIGRRDDHLVARVHGDEEGVVEDLLAAGGDDRVGGLVVEPVLALKFGCDRFAQRRNAEHRRILGLAALDRLDRRKLDVVGRVEIRLADRKRDHLPPLGFQIARLLRHRDGRGWLDAREDVGEEGHGRRAPFGCGGFERRTYSETSAPGQPRLLSDGQRRRDHPSRAPPPRQPHSGDAAIAPSLRMKSTKARKGAGMLRLG